MKNIRNVTARLALAGVTLIAAPAAFADTVGSYLIGKDDKKQTLTISYRNDNAIRMDMGHGAWTLVTGAKVYMVTEREGKVTVIDMASMPKFAMPEQKKTGAGKATINRTGRKETIAGIPGEVIEITTAADGQAAPQKHEAVISTDKRALGLSKAFIALGKRLGQAMGGGTSAQVEQALRDSGQLGTGALLRTDQVMVLQSVAEQALPASHYQLPAGATPMQMPVMDPAAMKAMQEAMKKKPASP